MVVLIFAEFVFIFCSLPRVYTPIEVSINEKV